MSIPVSDPEMTHAETVSTAASAVPVQHCRHCGAALRTVLANLGASPVANDFLDPGQLGRAEPFYPLEVLVCSNCRLAQTHDVLGAGDIFRDDYVYFSSHSTTWLEHARVYVEAMIARFGIGAGQRWVELASNDGYLLGNVKAAGIASLGVEPCRSVAEAAIAKGIETRIEFFGVECARRLAGEGWAADVITANNVFAHVPFINDFAGGIAALLKPEGVATIEVQHLLRLMQRNQFDTIYFEHFSYLSLIAGMKIFESVGLRVFDVEEPSTHGGSIRFFLCHKGAAHAQTENVARVLNEELAYGLDKDATYEAWAERVRETKRALLALLIGLKREGKTIAAYGAPAKGVTLLNYCGVGRDFIDFAVDRAPSKQNLLMPGVHIPVHAPEEIFARKPDYVLILPWNLKGEIMEQMAGIRAWGGRFIVPIPAPAIID
jgi:hypothetical protein